MFRFLPISLQKFPKVNENRNIIYNLMLLLNSNTFNTTWRYFNQGEMITIAVEKYLRPVGKLLCS